MTLKDIIVKYSLNGEEQTVFTKYTRNHFDNAEEITEDNNGFLAVWENIIRFAKIFGADKAINQKVCPKRPVAFASPDTLDISIYDSFAAVPSTGEGAMQRIFLPGQV